MNITTKTKFAATAFFFAAGTLFSFAETGTPFYWVAGESGETGNYEFGASKENESGTTISNWRNKSGDKTYYVAPKTFDTYDAWLNAGDDDFKITAATQTAGTTAELDLSGGLDLVVGANSQTILVNNYYGFNGYKTYNDGDYGTTFKIGENGGLGAVFTLNLKHAKIDVALANSVGQVATRILARATNSGWGKIDLSDSFVLSADGYEVISTKYESEAAAKAAVSAGKVAYFLEGNQLGVAYMTIPEPSAFGLLAGLGALALVASRRRRK